MNMKHATVAIVLGFASMAAHADIVFKCLTTNHHIIQLEHDNGTDQFSLAYGTDGKMPEIYVSKAGNNLGMGQTQAQGSETKELYFPVGQDGGIVTLGMIDKGNSFDGYINDGGKLSDMCQGRVYGNFRDPKLFQNLTGVDEEGDE